MIWKYTDLHKESFKMLCDFKALHDPFIIFSLGFVINLDSLISCHGFNASIA